MADFLEEHDQFVDYRLSVDMNIENEGELGNSNQNRSTKGESSNHWFSQHIRQNTRFTESQQQTQDTRLECQSRSVSRHFDLYFRIVFIEIMEEFV